MVRQSKIEETSTVMKRDERTGREHDEAGGGNERGGDGNRNG